MVFPSLVMPLMAQVEFVPTQRCNNPHCLQSKISSRITLNSASRIRHYPNEDINPHRLTTVSSSDVPKVKTANTLFLVFLYLYLFIFILGWGGGIQKRRPYLIFIFSNQSYLLFQLLNIYLIILSEFCPDAAESLASNANLYYSFELNVSVFIQA